MLYLLEATKVPEEADHHQSQGGGRGLNRERGPGGKKEKGKEAQDRDRIGTETTGDETSPESALLHPRTAISDSSGDEKNPSTATEAPKGYIISRWKVTEEQYEYVRSLTEGLSKNTAHLFAHILVCSTRPSVLWREERVPISSRLIDRKLPGARWLDLLDRGLIEPPTEWSKRGRLSREYRATDEVLETFIGLAPRTTEEYLKANKVNLFTGKRTTGREKSKVKDESNNAHPELICDALRVIGTNYYDAPAVEAHIARLEDTIIHARALWEASGRVPDTPEHKSYRRAKAQYYNDRSCYDSVKKQNPKEVGDGIWAFSPAYGVQGSGRISHIGGGLQSCSRHMKEAAYSRLRERGLKNYDLKSSQVRILTQFFEEAGIDTTWLRHYDGEPAAKHQYAEKVGIGVDAWKRILCALLMGASLPRSFEKSTGAVVSEMRKEVSPESLPGAYQRLYDVVAPLKARLNEWHTYLVSDYLKSHGRKHNVSGKVYIRNEVGKVFYPADVRNAHERKGDMAAFLLQGKEAAFIHALTALSTRYGFQVLANEHDGLVTVGEIPEEAIQAAAARANLRYTTLVEKPFCDAAPLRMAA